MCDMHQKCFLFSPKKLISIFFIFQYVLVVSIAHFLLDSSVDWFAGIGLTQLDLSQNSMGSVPSPALKNLHHLLILNLNHNKISVVHSKAFEGLDTLEILTLYENKISNIEEGAFKGLSKLVPILFF